MTAHILDLYDIHARGQAAATVYRNVLQQGVHPILHRDVPYYTSPPASVSLSTTSPRFAGKPAAYRSLTG